MDYLYGLPMDYPKWTTLKFVTNINLTMLEPVQTIPQTQIQLRFTTQNWSFFLQKKNQVDPGAEFERVFLLLRTCTNPASGRST